MTIKGKNTFFGGNLQYIPDDTMEYKIEFPRETDLKTESQKETNKYDLVNKPKHYQLNINGIDIEVLDVIKVVLTREEYIGFLKGNCIKYQLRSQEKGENQDWCKSGYYNNKLKELLEED